MKAFILFFFFSFGSPSVRTFSSRASGRGSGKARTEFLAFCEGKGGGGFAKNILVKHGINTNIKLGVFLTLREGGSLNFGDGGC